MAIPILDTTAAVWRRIRDKKSLISPDRGHVHHKLMNLGLNTRQICAVLFGLQAALSILVIISLNLAEYWDVRWPSQLVLGSAYLLAIGFFGALHFMNRKALKVEEHSVTGYSYVPGQSITPIKPILPTVSRKQRSGTV